MADIDTSIKSYYQAQALSKEQLNRLMGYQRLPRKQPSKSGWVALSGLAASFVLMIGLFWGGYFQSSLSQSVAKEIAMNHIKQMEVEYKGSRFAELAQQMKQLDFQLRRPSKLPLSDLRLVGSRYCSIQGQIAAQVKLKDTHNRLYTLYQTQLRESLRGLTQTELMVKGVKVTIWREGDAVFGFAQ